MINFEINTTVYRTLYKIIVNKMQLWLDRSYRSFSLMVRFRKPWDISSLRKRGESTPNSSEVLTCHLRQRNTPHWTSYFVKYRNVVDDQRGMSHFNWTVEGVNYHVLRTGCYPYIKYHCTRRPYEDLTIDDTFFRLIKIINLGIPCLAYGLVSVILVTCHEEVITSKGVVLIYFHIKEDHNAQY